MSSDPQGLAIAYLAARGDMPWRWADDGEVIVWADGTTIAFRAEIAFVLEWLVPHGWPTFGALVWLLAACRGKLPPPLSPVHEFELRSTAADSEEASSGQLSLSTFHDRIRSMHASVEAGLSLIARLPEDRRATLKAKAVLAEIVFAGSQREAGEDWLRSAIVEALRSGTLTDVMLNDPGAPPAEGNSEWMSLYEGLREITAETLSMRLATGLDELPQAAEIPPIASQRARALLADLLDDSEHAGLARLARDFMAALQLPRRLSEPDEMPIGGFADLANRGSLDRLLLSELAHDDLTLAVRIALNEALYLRREPPAKQPPSTLSVLIDSGVRVWGVPRILAAAVTLALIARSGRQESLFVFRASGDELVPVDMLSRTGLIAHLGALETHAHPGRALDAFRRVVREQERSEAVLVTHRDVLADVEFQRLLAQAEYDMIYLAVVDREGGFELLRYPHGGAPVCQARVNIDDLWPSPAVGTPSRRQKPLIDREAHPELPLCFSRDSFPLLLAVRGKVQASVPAAEGGGLCVMQDRRLLQWDGPSRGARTLAWSLPRGRTMWLGKLTDGTICVVKSHGGCQQIACRVFLPNGDLVISQEWRFREPVRRVHVRGVFIFLICLKEATVRNLVTGEQLGQLELSRGPSHDIYFRGAAGEWMVLAWDGMKLDLAPVTLSSVVPKQKVLRIFNRQGIEGPWCITSDGEIYSHEASVVLRLGPLQHVVRVSESGHRLLVAESASRTTVLVDLPTLTHRGVTGVVRDEDWEWKPTPPTRTVRVRFDRIAISSMGILHLHARRGSWWMLFPDGGSLLVTSAGDDLEGVAFEELRLPGELGFSVSVARWPDGRCAWLDDRGMLHLRCADRSHPELTIVLSEQPGVWSSDGHWMGSEFYIGDHPRSDPAVFLERLSHFCQPTPALRRSGT